MAGVPPRPHGIVRIGEVDQRGAFAPGGGDERFEVLTVVSVRHGDEPAAEAGDVIIEGRIGAERGHDRRAGIDDEPHREAQNAVDAFAHHDVVGGDPMGGGDRRLEVEILWIAVFPRLRGLRRHGGDRLGGWPEGVLVGADAGAETPTTGAFLGFRADERHGRGQAVDQSGEAGGHCGRSRYDNAERQKVGRLVATLVMTDAQARSIPPPAGREKCRRLFRFMATGTTDILRPGLSVEIHFTADLSCETCPAFPANFA